jgi:phosphatidylserine/phosphatidylglycerophosphate/cardiolipin synthase-like enzyme
MDEIIETTAMENITYFQILFFLLAAILMLLVVVILMIMIMIIVSACRKNIGQYKKENDKNIGAWHESESAQGILKVNSGTQHPNFIKEGGTYNLYIGINAGGKMMGAIRNAQKSIQIISPYLNPDELKVIFEKHAAGLTDIAIITSASDSNLQKSLQVEALKKLIEENRKENGEYMHTPVFIKSLFLKDDFFHAKLYIVDDNTAFVGSLNFTKGGIENNHETCVTIKDPDIVKALSEYYNGLFVSNLETCDVEKLGKKIYIINANNAKEEN